MKVLSEQVAQWLGNFT